MVLPHFLSSNTHWPLKIVPCLRRVSQLAYGSNGADDDTEEIMSFALAGGDTDDDWVATHVGSGGG